MNRPFEIDHLDHVVLRTADLPRLVAFYEGLGCSVERDSKELGMCSLRAGVSMLDIVDIEGMVGQMGDQGSPPDVDGRNVDHFAFRVEPYDETAILEYCEEHGIEAKAAPFALLGADGYGPAVYLSDPAGNRVELKGPPSEDQTPPTLPKSG